jgi:hypothetical protein
MLNRTVLAPAHEMNDAPQRSASPSPSHRPSKKTVVLTVLFCFAAVVLPWMSLTFTVRLLLFGQVIILPWAAWINARQALKLYRESGSALKAGGCVLFALLLLALALAALSQFFVEMGWLRDVAHSRLP